MKGFRVIGLVAVTVLAGALVWKLAGPPVTAYAATGSAVLLESVVEYPKATANGKVALPPELEGTNPFPCQGEGSVVLSVKLPYALPQNQTKPGSDDSRSPIRAYLAGSDGDRYPLWLTARSDRTRAVIALPRFKRARPGQLTVVIECDGKPDSKIEVNVRGRSPETSDEDILTEHVDDNLKIEGRGYWLPAADAKLWPRVGASVRCVGTFKPGATMQWKDVSIKLGPEGYPSIIDHSSPVSSLEGTTIPGPIGANIVQPFASLTKTVRISGKLIVREPQPVRAGRLTQTRTVPFDLNVPVVRVDNQNSTRFGEAEVLDDLWPPETSARR